MPFQQYFSYIVADPEKTTDLSQVTVRQTLSHNVVHLALNRIQTHSIRGDRVSVQSVGYITNVIFMVNGLIVRFVDGYWWNS
jgi:hypothetical protein